MTTIPCGLCADFHREYDCPRGRRALWEARNVPMPRAHRYHRLSRLVEDLMGALAEVA